MMKEKRKEGATVDDCHRGCRLQPTLCRPVLPSHAKRGAREESKRAREARDSHVLPSCLPPPLPLSLPPFHTLLLSIFSRLSSQS